MKVYVLYTIDLSEECTILGTFEFYNDAVEVLVKDVQKDYHLSREEIIPKIVLLINYGKEHYYYEFDGITYCIDETVFYGWDDNPLQN